MKTRIAKYIADTGVASRRAAEELIASGAVTVNGVVVETPVCFIEPDDVVAINGKTITPDTTPKLYVFNKPMNTMTTRMDPDGRKTIYECLPPEYRHLKYVGRLDYRTTGLLLMTNDGNLARQLTLPASRIPRVYIAVVNGRDMSKLDLARAGMTVNGITYQPMKIDVLPDKNLRVQIYEGKKNEVRRVLRACGLPVNRLHRISFGPIRLGNLKPTKIRQVDQKTIDAILKTL